MKKSVKKLDKIITGVVIGTAVASMVGLSQTKKGKEVTNEIKQKSTGLFSKIKKFYGKTMLFAIKIFNKKK